MTSNRSDERLLIYGDSRSLPRGHEGVRVEDTWISHLSEHHIIYFRGHGGITSTQILKLFNSDKSYFYGEQKLIVIFFIGIVDAAPRPITYLLKSLPLQKIWGGVQKRLVPFRAQIQKQFSYRIVTPSKFEHNVRRLLALCQENDWPSIVVGNPLPPTILENRSPGFRESTMQYNEVLKKCCDEFRQTYFLSLDNFDDTNFISVDDGHHLGISGHRSLSNYVLWKIRTLQT